MNYLILKKMKNYKYRIKITEQNDGTKSYTPQVIIPVNRFLEWFGIECNIFGSDEKCFNIIKDNNQFTELETLSHSYSSEFKALEVIEEYKQWARNEHAKQTKEITYKEL